MTASHDQQARRRYWAEYMDRMDDLIEQLLVYPVEECGDPMGSLPDAMQAAEVDVLFSNTKIDGDLERIYFIRAGLLPDLVNIARDMNQRGWIMRIEDGFRTQEMQTRLVRGPQTFDRIVRTCIWECEGKKPPIDLLFRRSRVMIANHAQHATHMHGAAVDISVFRQENGSEVWRGKSYLEMSEYTPMQSPFITAEERANRNAITQIMERHGFMHFPGEFWHYNKGDLLYQILINSGAPGVYGPVHWDADTNQVTPCEDPLRPLVPRDQFESELEKAMARLELT